MQRTLLCSLILPVISAMGTGETVAADPQANRTLVSAIHDLRMEIRTTAATIQTVQIVMYRLQSQAATLDRASQRFERAEEGCNQLQSQQKMYADQIARFEVIKEVSQNPAEQKKTEEFLANLKSSMAALTTDEQEHQLERTEAESQFRREQAKMSELQDQLDQLDRTLAQGDSSSARR